MPRRPLRAAEDIKPSVEFREPEVERDQVGLFDEDGIQAGLTVGPGDQLDTQRGHGHLDQTTEQGSVLDQEYPAESSAFHPVPVDAPVR